jgi:formylglycine-generating enzyme required for sulfatase activity
VTLPATLAIVSRGGPDVTVQIDVAVSRGGVQLDAREVTVDGVPVDRVVELDVFFDGACEGSASASAPQACSTPNACRVRCDGDALPPEGSDAGALAVLASPDDGGDSVDAAAEVGAPDSGGESGVDPASCAAVCPAGSHCVSGGCVPLPPSCLAGHSGADVLCGSDGAHDCCGAHDVPGGGFLRSGDGIGVIATDFPATVSPFRLDDEEVTVGRFRQFVNAVTGSPAAVPWVPPAGSGTHAHLAGGMGLVNASDAGPPFESGWDSAWNASLPATAAAWTDALNSCEAFTWNYLNEGSERKPVNCVSWYDAYAFCIWDGGFLPTEAEWNYAAAGGDEQRAYPWGAQDPGADTTLAVYGCYYGGSGPGTCRGSQNIPPVGTAGGLGRWGQLDLAGSLWEWCLDWYAPYGSSCADCAALSGGSERVNRGGSYDTASSYLRSSYRLYSDPSYRSNSVGIRCAREP